MLMCRTSRLPEPSKLVGKPLARLGGGRGMGLWGSAGEARVEAVGIRTRKQGGYRDIRDWKARERSEVA